MPYPWKQAFEIQDHENLPEECADILTEHGFDADTVKTENLSGAEDDSVFLACQSDGRTPVTRHLDFASITRFPPGTHEGIVVLRARVQDKESLLRLMRRVTQVLLTRSPQKQL